MGCLFSKASDRFPIDPDEELGLSSAILEENTDAHNNMMYNPYVTDRNFLHL